VESAYLAAWEAYGRALRTLDTAVLSAHHAGAALARRRDEVEVHRRQGTTARLSVRHDVALVGVEGDRGSIFDHYVDRSAVLDGATGEPLARADGEVVALSVDVALVEGRWKVTGLYELVP
jgi:hypothetical protein